MQEEQEQHVNFHSKLAEGISDALIHDFQQIVLERYAAEARPFPWRETHDPYAIWVSEVMLQQTQTERVVPKYLAFLAAFPRLADLAAAPVPLLLEKWQGLGYNRRALAMKKAAGEAMQRFGGQLPESLDDLMSLPGIGPYTAAAIRAFAFGQPGAFIETNIRRVFLFFFFPGREGVHDRELMPVIERAQPQGVSPRDWYYALMDYGVLLAKAYPNANRRSRHYAKQSAFEGSDRQVRGKVLRALLAEGRQTIEQLGLSLRVERERLERILAGLRVEGFVELEDNTVALPKH